MKSIDLFTEIRKKSFDKFNDTICSKFPSLVSMNEAYMIEIKDNHQNPFRKLFQFLTKTNQEQNSILQSYNNYK